MKIKHRHFVTLTAVALFAALTSLSAPAFSQQTPSTPYANQDGGEADNTDTDEQEEPDDEGEEEVDEDVVSTTDIPSPIATPIAQDEDEDEVEEEVVIMESIGSAEPEPKRLAAPVQTEDEDLQTPDIVITGTRLERNLKEAPVRTQVVKREQLEQRKARNLYEALNYTTGVRVETNCQNCGFSQLRLNGLAGSYTQVLIDGLPSFSGLAGVYGLEQLPAEMIERLEVVKGGGSALYGPSAVAGVVNLITRKPKEDYASALVSLDMVGVKAPDLRVTTDGGIVSDNGKVGAHFFLTARRRNELDLNEDDFSELTRLRQLAAGTNIIFTPIEKGDLSVAFHSLREYRRGGDNIDKPAHDVAIAEELRTDRYQGEVRWKHDITDYLDYSIGYVFSHTDRQSYYGGGGDGGLPTLDTNKMPTQDQVDQVNEKIAALGGYGRTSNPLHIADAHVNIKYDFFGPQVVTVGTQATIDHVDDSYLGYDRKINETSTDFGVYLQHDWIFADWGESVLGARLDKHSTLKSPIVSPRAALKFRPLHWLDLRTAFSMGFRAPQPFDEDLHIETVGGDAVIITNAPGLKPERSLSLSQQISTDFHFSNGDELDLGLNGYFTQLRDAFDLKVIENKKTPEQDKQRYNRGTTTVAGAELEATYRTRLFALRAGWTFEHARNSDPDEDFNSKAIFRTPDNYGYLDAVFKYTGLQAQLGINVVGPMLVPHMNADGDPEKLETSPWFFDISGSVSYAFQTMDTVLIEPFIGFRNILDSRQKDFDKGADRDSAYIYGPEQPRTIYAGVRGTI